MKKGANFYTVTRKVHLYAALATAVLVLMYIVTSYMMMYYDFFKTHESREHTETVAINSTNFSENNWQKFMTKHDISGRKVAEYENDNDDLVRRYESTGEITTVTFDGEGRSAEIRKQIKSAGGKIVARHRMRGYGGPWQYNLYAFLLDMTGISLILFAITGVIMWLKILNHNRIAWIIFISGLAYVSVVIGYLLLV